MLTWEAWGSFFTLPGVASFVGSSGHLRMPIFGGSADPRFLARLCHVEYLRGANLCSPGLPLI